MSQSPTRVRRARLVRDPTNRYPLPAIPRGADALWLLHTFRFATNDQIERVCWRDPTQPDRNVERAANTALRRLFDSGFVHRVPVFVPGRAGGAPLAHYVNTLTPAGARVVVDTAAERRVAIRPWRSSLRPRPWQPLLHEFWIVEFGVTALAACQAVGLSVAAWADDRQLAAWRKVGRLSLANVPDAYLLLDHPGTGKAFPCLIEIDQGSETVVARSPGRRDWRRKVAGYLPYLEHAFQAEFGMAAKPVVLTVTTSEARLQHLMATTRQTGGGGRFWFTTQAQLYPLRHDHERSNSRSAGLQAPFWASIWRTPADDGWRSLATRCGLSRA